MQKSTKSLHKGGMGMYQFKRKQISIGDFGQPDGMTMNPNNRWVKKAEMIPWDEIELRYAKLFMNNKGNIAKPLRLALLVLFKQNIIFPMKKHP